MRRRDSAPNDALALTAALLFAIAPASIFWTATLFSETLFTLGVASTLAVALWASKIKDQAPSPLEGEGQAQRARVRATAAYFIVGLVLVATAFVRSQGLVLIVPVMVLLAPKLRIGAVARVAAPLLAAMALLVVPWTLRNEIAMGRPYPINDNLGYNLRLAHAPYARGTSVPPQDLWDERPGISFYERELFFDDEGRRRAITYAREHPGRELELAVRRVGWLLRSDAEPAVRWSESLGVTPIGRGRDAFVLLGHAYWYALVVLTGAALSVSRRERVWLALWSTVGVWLALHLVFAGEPRYHVPLVPVLVILAAATAVRVAEMVRSQRVGQV